MSDKISIIGRKVREERKAQGMTQTELAGLSGVGLNFISQLEQGKKSVQMDKVLMVLDTLGLEVELRYAK